LICVNCNKIVDGEMTLDQESLRNLEMASGYEILRPQICLYGLCPDCRADR
jgi:Fe2+ or Zn2+ uptake regulation protein